MDQTSMAAVYRLFDSMISGARYHLVATSATSQRADSHTNHPTKAQALRTAASACVFRTALPRDSILTFRHPELLVLGRLARDGLVPSCEAKVADLELAVAVDEQVARLEVAVDHVRRVDVLDAAEELVEEELDVQVAEGLAAAHDLVQVRLHGLHVEVDLVVPVPDIVEVNQPRQVLVFSKVPQQRDLAQRPARQDGLVEDARDALDRNGLPGHRVLDGHDEAVRTLPQGPEQAPSVGDVEEVIHCVDRVVPPAFSQHTRHYA